MESHVWSLRGGAFSAFFVPLGPLAAPGPLLGLSWASPGPLGSPWAALGGSLGSPGASLAPLGPLLRTRGALLGLLLASWGPYFGAFGSCFTTPWENHENL